MFALARQTHATVSPQDTSRTRLICLHELPPVPRRYRPLSRVSLEADCRGEAFAVESDGSLLVERERDAESCRMRLFVAGEAAYDEDVPGYKGVTLTVGPDGEVDVEAVVH